MKYTPPQSPLDQTVEEPTSSRRAFAAERERRKTRKRHSREIKALKEKVHKEAKQTKKVGMVEKKGSNRKVKCQTKR